MENKKVKISTRIYQVLFWIFGILLGLVSLGDVIVLASGLDKGFPIVFLIICISFSSISIYLATHPSSIERSGEKQKSRKKTDREQRFFENEQKRELKRLATTIVAVSIIGSDSKNKTSSAVGRAIVGDFVAGGFGSIVGASTAKKDGMTKFLVEFADGHKAIETVKDNSMRFKELIKYVKM